MMGEALSRSEAWRKIGLLRYRAAKTQTKWSQHLTWLRKKHQESKAEKRRNEANKGCSGKTDDQNPLGTGDDQGSEENSDDSDESESDVTMADVRGEMKPFVSEQMD